MKNKKVKLEAIERWGNKKQQEIAIEEMAELTKAIVKSWRYDVDLVLQHKLAEEIADVEIMMDYLRLTYSIPESLISETKDIKINRLKDRLSQKKETCH